LASSLSCQILEKTVTHVAGLRCHLCRRLRHSTAERIFLRQVRDGRACETLMEPPDCPAPHFGPGTGSRDGLGSGSGIGEASPTFEARPSHRLVPARPFSHLSAARRKRAWRPRAALARPFMSAEGKLVPRYGRAESTTSSRHSLPRSEILSRLLRCATQPLLDTLVIRHQSAKSSEKIRPIMSQRGSARHLE
jgi:hypothetical protein